MNRDETTRDEARRDERIYRLLLSAYPASFRESYEREMLLVFRDQRRDGVTAHVGYWIALVADTARNAPREWEDQLTSNFRSEEREMKRMAIATIVVSAFELLNTAIELQAGGWTGRDSLSQLTLGLVLLSTLVLLIAGVSLVRRGHAAVPFARVAAVECVASFAFIGYSRPVLSGLGMLVGLGFPIVLLIYLSLGGRGRPSAATT